MCKYTGSNKKYQNTFDLERTNNFNVRSENILVFLYNPVYAQIFGSYVRDT